MTDLEREMLAIVADQVIDDGRTERRARALGMSRTQIVQQVNSMIDRPDVLAADPATVLRLRRIREQRVARRRVTKSV